MCYLLQKPTPLSNPLKQSLKSSLTGRPNSPKVPKSSRAVPVCALLLLCAGLLSIRTVRWNAALMLYMPLLGGYPFELTFLQPVYDAWVELELQSAHTFVHPAGPVVREIAAADYSWAELMRVSENMRYPVVLRGVMNGSVAMRTFGTPEWSEKYGQFPILEARPTKEFKYEYEMLEQGTFAELLEGIRRGEHRVAYGLDELYFTHPELADTVELERLGAPGARGTDLCRSMSLFPSSSGEGLRWHNEDHLSMGTQLVGSKTWSLIDQEFIPLLGPHSNGDPYSTGYSFRASQRVHDLLPQHTFTVHAGDALMITTYVLHRVASHGDPDTNACVLNTCRFGVEAFNSFGAVTTQPVLELFQHIGSAYWIHPAIPTFTRFIPYFKVLQDNVRAIMGTTSKWDDTECFSSKKVACRNEMTARGWVVNDKSSTGN